MLVQTLFVFVTALVILGWALLLLVKGGRRYLAGDDGCCWMVLGGVGLLVIDYALLDCWTALMGLGV